MGRPVEGRCRQGARGAREGPVLGRKEVPLVDSAFIISWKVPFPGRERQALQLAAEADGFWGKQVAEGKCTSPEWYFLPTGWGMYVVKGERRALEELVASDESRRLLTKGTLLLEDWQWALAETDTGAQRLMADYANTLEQV